MENYDLIMKDLMTYTPDECFYKAYYEAKQSKDPNVLQQFLKNYTPEEAQKRLLICPELNADFKYDYIRETGYKTLKYPMNIYIQKHNRYSPEFMHMHQYFELFYVLSGNCRHTIDGRQSILTKGTLCFISPETEHSVGVFDDSIVIDILIQKTTFDDMFFSVIRSKDTLSHFFVSNIVSKSAITHLTYTLEDNELEHLLLSMYLEQVADDEYTNRLLNAMMCMFFAKLTRKYDRSAALHYTDNTISKSNLELLVYINDHHKTVTLAELADHFHYSIEHCSRLIRNVTGLSFTNFLRRIRMRRAETLLLSTGLSIDEISVLVGYENTSTFISLFKKIYQMTPGQFRRNAPKSLELSGFEISV